MNLFTERKLRLKAFMTGFCKKISVFTPLMFFDILCLDACSDKTKSLNQLAVHIKSVYGVDISKQGINSRFNEGSVKFMQSLVGDYLAHQVLKPLNTEWLSLFKRVLVKDSTKFDLPASLMKEMPGFGGGASKSGACIQFEFDLKNGEVVVQNITPANVPDNNIESLAIENVQEGDLVIRDLGYFKLTHFMDIQEKEASFISRLNTSLLVYQKDEKGSYKELDFEQLYQQMQEGAMPSQEMEVYVGQKNKFFVRLIVELVPEEVYNLRMKKINAYNKKKGFHTSEKYKARARFNLFMTNIPADKLERKAISKIYKIRWQVELIFKVWKSIFKIDNIHQMKYHRLMCLLNIRLLIILINWETFMINRGVEYENTGKLLSMIKCFNTLKEYILKLITCLVNECHGLKEWFKWTASIFQTKHWLEEKKKKIGLLELLLIND
jgi:hypothetical protein